MAVDTSRDAVEWLSDEASFDGRQECADTLRALLARAEAAGAAHVTSQLALKQALDQRDAAIAERDRLAEALAQARREGAMAQREHIALIFEANDMTSTADEIRALPIRSAAGEGGK